MAETAETIPEKENETVPASPEPEEDKGPETAEEKEENTSSPAKGSRQKQAREKVEAARKRVHDAEEEIENCLQKIRGDLARFEQYEHQTLIPVMEEGRQLLKKIGVDEIRDLSVSPAETELEYPEEEKMRIGDLPSGRGSSFLYALLGGIAALAGWTGYAALKAGVALSPAGLSDLASLSRLAGSLAEGLGLGSNPAVGAAVAVTSSLLLMWIIYAVRVSLRASSNLKKARKIEEEAGFYCQKKEECKAKMEQVREHLKTMDQTAHKYEVLLAEKNAALRRALYLEEAQSFDALHARTQETVRETGRMIRELEHLLETPMARSGILTEESVEALRQAKRVVNDLILRLYS